MYDHLIEVLKKDPVKWEEVQHLFVERRIPAKTILLNEGEVATHLFFVKKGCLRIWLNKDGKEITFQFFFENQAVSSIDSLINNKPSACTIESLEPSVIVALSKQNLEKLLQRYPMLKQGMDEVLFQRLLNYANLFLSRIKDSPRERYVDLIKQHPEIIQRVPQHYIASYLGITPISLSRIRRKMAGNEGRGKC